MPRIHRRKYTKEELETKKIVDKYADMAKKIVMELGEEKKESPVGCYHAGDKHYKQYKGYGIEIVMDFFDHDSISVIYNEQTVLYRKPEVIIHGSFFDPGNYYSAGKEMIKEGLWEDILKELFVKYPVISAEIAREKNRIAKANSMVGIVNEVTDLLAESLDYSKDKEVKIVVNSSTTLSRIIYNYGYDDNYCGITYIVYQNDKKVFCFNYDRLGKCTIHDYISGDWESTLEESLEYARKKVEEKRSEKEKEKVKAYINELRRK